MYEDGKDVYSMDEGDSPAIYPVYLRAKNSFDAGKIYREGPTGQTTGQIDALLQEVGDDSHPYYQQYAGIKSFYRSVAEEQKFLESLVDDLVANPEFNYSELETLAPFIRSAGYDSYIDYENSIADPATGIAIFDPSNIKGVFAQYDPSGVPEGAQYSDDIMFSRRKSSTPIENAVELATTKYADYNTAVEEEFFGEFWPRMMTEVKGTVTRDKVRTASKRAVKDINEFVSRNPKYQDYYDNDQKAVKLALEQEFPGITPDDLAFYQLANGLSSPATSLPANVGDALNFLSLYKRDGNLDAIEMEMRKRLDKNGKPIENLVIKKSPFSASLVQQGSG